MPQPARPNVCKSLRMIKPRWKCKENGVGQMHFNQLKPFERMIACPANGMHIAICGHCRSSRNFGTTQGQVVVITNNNE